MNPHQLPPPPATGQVVMLEESLLPRTLNIQAEPERPPVATSRVIERLDLYTAILGEVTQKTIEARQVAINTKQKLPPTLVAYVNYQKHRSILDREAKDITTAKGRAELAEFIARNMEHLQIYDSHAIDEDEVYKAIIHELLPIFETSPALESDDLSVRLQARLYWASFIMLHADMTCHAHHIATQAAVRILEHPSIQCDEAIEHACALFQEEMNRFGHNCPDILEQILSLRTGLTQQSKAYITTYYLKAGVPLEQQIRIANLRIQLLTQYLPHNETDKAWRDEHINHYNREIETLQKKSKNEEKPKLKRASSSLKALGASLLGGNHNVTKD